MLNEKEKNKISKFLSLVLRHKPELIGINLDNNGWTDVEELIKKSSEHGIEYDLKSLQNIVETNNKQRFTFNTEMNGIRANQGHSINIELGYTSTKPPEVLFHGTAVKSVEIILAKGLQKRNRTHVHLSSDLETANKVGQRHGKPYIFSIMAEEMHQDKYEFFLSANGVWLTDHVPIKYIMHDQQSKKSR